MDRNKLIQLIHLAKASFRVCPLLHHSFYHNCPECERKTRVIKDDEYKKLLISLTNKSSCTNLDYKELSKVLDFFNKSGFKEFKYSNLKLRNEEDIRKSTYKMRWSLMQRAKQILGDNHENRLKGFIKKKFPFKRFDELNLKELRLTLGWISRIEKTNK